MTSLSKLALGTALSLAFMNNALAVKIAAMDMGILSNSDGTGIYQNKIKEASKRQGLTYREDYYPTGRAILYLKKSVSDCAYGPIQQYRSLGLNNLLISKPLGTFSMFLFFKKNVAHQTLKDLRGKSVGALQGFEDLYQVVINANINIQYVSSANSLVGMLDSSRVSAIIGFLPDLNEHRDQLSYDKNDPLLVQNDYLVCLKNEATKKFINGINRELPALNETP